MQYTARPTGRDFGIERLDRPVGCKVVRGRRMQFGPGSPLTQSNLRQSASVAPYPRGTRAEGARRASNTPKANIGHPKFAG